MFRLRRKMEKTRVLVQKTEISNLSVILFFFFFNAVFFFFSKPHVHKRALVSFPFSLEKEKASKQSHLHHTAELLKEMKERKGEEKKKKRVARRVRTELDAEKQKKKSVEESDNRGQFPFASRHSIESWVKPKKKKKTGSFDISHGRTQQ